MHRQRRDSRHRRRLNQRYCRYHRHPCLHLARIEREGIVAILNTVVIIVTVGVVTDTVCIGIDGFIGI